MAEENPQNINPATDPQVEDPPATAVPASQVDRTPAEVNPSTNPEVPQPVPAQAVTLAPKPDAAFQEAEAVKENRWIQAAATNPENINNNGSVVVDRGDGVVETINRDGSYSVRSGEGTFTYNADGQQTSYTTPTFNGTSETVLADGQRRINTTVGGITVTSVLDPNSQGVAFSAEYALPDATLAISGTGDLRAGGITLVSSGDPEVDAQREAELRAQLNEQGIVNENIFVTTRTAEAQQAQREAAATAAAENQALREDLIAAKQQTESGIPLSATQQAALEAQAQAAAAADAALAQADEALAEADPTVVAPDTDPQVAAPAGQDTIPNLATTDFSPAEVTGDPEIDIFAAQQEAAEFVPVSDIDTGPVEVTQDEEIISFEQAQAQNDFVPESEIDTDPTEVTQDEQIISFEEAQAQNEFVPAAAIDTAAADVDPADNPGVPQPVDDLPDAFVYDTADTIELADDPIILAQADATATDVALVDIADDPAVVFDDDPAAIEPTAPPEGGFYGEPTPVGGNFTAAYDPETGTYSVVDLDTGETVETGLSQQQATLAAEEFSIGDPQFPNETDALGAAADSDIIREPTDVDVAEAQFVETDTGFFELQEEAAPQPDEFGFVEADDGFFVTQEEIEAGIDQQQFEGETDPEEFVPLSEIEGSPEPVLASDAAEYGADAEGEGEVIEFTADGPVTRDANQAISDAAIAQGAVANARNQQSIREQRGNNVDTADWRVRIRLAPQATYLYKDPACGILQPLAVSDGVIFPYMPSIQTVYKANYTPYNLTHSNYRGYFYQGSSVEDINITGIFTAQDSVEAAYLLAVIHFFRSVTKMFYGQDPQRGAPPPLVYLSALGASQYVDAPCVVGQFNYNLPTDVDYIRAGAPNQDGTNLLKRRDRQYLPTNRFSYALERVRAAGLPRGGEVFPPPPPTLGLNRPTYVPTRMEISLILHPMQSRQQVSQQFSVKEYGPGRLQSKGFW